MLQDTETGTEIPPSPAGTIIQTGGYEVLSVREVTGLFAELRQTAVWFLGIYLSVFLIAGLFIYMMMRRTVEQMEKLQEVAEKQELLMGALSHEMRTPLTSIIGYSDTLRHVKLKDETERPGTGTYQPGGKTPGGSFREDAADAGALSEPCHTDGNDHGR